MVLINAPVPDNLPPEHASVLQSCRALQQSERWEEAYKMLAAQPEKEVYAREQVDILLHALQGEEATTSAPPADDRPFHPKGNPLCAQGIPEISANELKPDLLGTALREHGHLLVRGMLDDGDTGSLITAIDESLGSRTDFHAGEEPPATHSPWYYPSPLFPGNHVSYSNRNASRKYGRTGSMPVIDSPRGAQLVLDVFRKIDLHALLEGHFGEQAVIAVRKWMFRLAAANVEADDGIGGGWHQDGQFMGESINTVNLWIALTPCGDGTSAPGIALIPRRFSRVLEYGTRGAKLDWTVGPDLVTELAEECPMIRPHFEAGDALFFDHLSLHRTGHAANQSRNRHALESWFYTRSATGGRPVIPFY